MNAPLALLDIDGPVARLRLNRPDRHNSLVPELVDATLQHLTTLSRRTDIRVVILEGAGRSFSTGGDVRAFFDTPRGWRSGYADALVGGLNNVILALFDLPMPVLGRIHGPVTGGSLGLMLACDLVAVTPAVFVQPYYTEVGFSPDGGWTAMLPARIGANRVREIQLLNQRLGADQLEDLGLANAVVPEERLDDTISGWTETLLAMQPGAVMATRSLLRLQADRQRIAASLDAEKRMFMNQIETDEAHLGMARFLGRDP